MPFAAIRKLVIGLAGAAALFVATGAAQAQQAPDVLVKSMMTDVLDSIKKDPSLKAGDQVKLNALVDEKILPYVDFNKMTRLAVGPGWRQASPDQRQKLTREFRTLLVKTYSGAVSAVTD